MINPTMKDIGRSVMYQKDWMSPDQIEFGEITSFNDKYVFVRYRCERQAKSTLRRDLKWS